MVEVGCFLDEFWVIVFVFFVVGDIDVVVKCIV